METIISKQSDALRLIVLLSPSVAGWGLLKIFLKNKLSPSVAGRGLLKIFPRKKYHHQHQAGAPKGLHTDSQNTALNRRAEKLKNGGQALPDFRGTISEISGGKDVTV